MGSDEECRLWSAHQRIHRRRLLYLLGFLCRTTNTHGNRRARRNTRRKWRRDSSHRPFTPRSFVVLGPCLADPATDRMGREKARLEVKDKRRGSRQGAAQILLCGCTEQEQTRYSKSCRKFSTCMCDAKEESGKSAQTSLFQRSMLCCKQAKLNSRTQSAL